MSLNYGTVGGVPGTYTACVAAYKFSPLSVDTTFSKYNTLAYKSSCSCAIQFTN